MFLFNQRLNLRLNYICEVKIFSLRLWGKKWKIFTSHFVRYCDINIFLLSVHKNVEKIPHTCREVKNSYTSRVVKNTSLKSCEVKNISHNRWGKILHISREVKNVSHNWWGKITSHKSWGNNFSIQLTMCEVIFPHQSCEIFLAHTTWVRYFYLVTYMRNFTSRLVWGTFSTFLCRIKIYWCLNTSQSVR